MIPAPRIIRWMKEKFNIVYIDILFLQTINGKIFHRFIIHINANLFALRKIFDEQTIVGINFINLSRPAFFFMRPAKPCSPVRRKFSRKIITELFGSIRVGKLESRQVRKIKRHYYLGFVQRFFKSIYHN